MRAFVSVTDCPHVLDVRHLVLIATTIRGGYARVPISYISIKRLSILISKFLRSVPQKVRPAIEDVQPGRVTALGQRPGPPTRPPRQPAPPGGTQRRRRPPTTPRQNITTTCIHYLRGTALNEERALKEVTRLRIRLGLFCIFRKGIRLIFLCNKHFKISRH